MTLALSDNTAPGERWDVRLGMREIRTAGMVDALPRLADDVRRALVPVRNGWLLKRLALMWAAMSFAKEDGAAKAWLTETARLLGDIPEDIVAEAIDASIRQATRGFIPAIGEIRRHADPALAKRKQQFARLESLLRFKESAPAEVEQITPEQLRDTLDKYGFGNVGKGGKRTADRELRKPTAADYRAMGVEPPDWAEGAVPSNPAPAEHDGTAGAPPEAQS